VIDNRLPGHELKREGRIFDVLGYRGKVGAAVCSCGWRSAVLDSDAARKRWHRDHKDAVRAALRGIERGQEQA
jgi:hypothetical protein